MLNTPAPDFTLQASNGQDIRLADLRSGYTVLVFYPMNDSPVCNRQLDQMNLNMAAFLQANARVFGVNTAPVKKQQEYCVRRKLEFPILSDPGGRVAKQYKAFTPFLWFNRRTVVVVDPVGMICFYKRGVPTTDEVLGAIQASAAKLQTPV